MGRIEESAVADEEQKHVYLAGAIEFAPDSGKAWRLELSEFLEGKLGLKVFNPCINEVELLSEEEKVNFRRWKHEQPKRFVPVVRRIIDQDLGTLISHTRFIVCLWDEYVTRGAGTAGELTVAYHYGIPVYMVAAMPLEKVSSWAIGCASELFGSFEELKAFLQAQYGPQSASLSTARLETADK